MLKLRGDRIRWRKSERFKMAEIVGPEIAGGKSRSVTYSASVVKLALRHGLDVSPTLRAVLDQAIKSEQQARAWQRLEAPKPTALDRTLFEHQRADLAYFRAMHLPAYLLAHEAGVGKTLSALFWARHIVGSARTLVITPNVAKDQWADAIHRWLPKGQRVTVVNGTKLEQAKLIRGASSGWVIGHWESLVNVQDAYLERPWNTVILDEAHAICNRDSKRSEIAAKLDADYRMALTAHPFINDETELWGILRFLYPERYTSFWAWFGMHINASPKPFGGYDVEGARRPKLLQWEMRPFTLRRRKREVFKSLPAITRVARHLDLTTRGQSEYKKLKKQFFAELDAIDGPTTTVVIPSELARLTRLRQYLIDPGLLGAKEPSLKYPAVLEWLDEISGPPVIFTSFQQAGRRLGAYLVKHGKRHIAYIDGAVKRRDRTKNKRLFLDGKLDALIVVTQAGGTALNLGKYGYVGHLDLPWSPKDLEQTEGRVDRPEEGSGALVATTSYRFIVRDSFEQRMERKLESKHAQFGRVFTIADLKGLFE